MSVMKRSIYLETSVIGAYLDNGDPLRRDLTMRWWEHEMNAYQPFISPLVERELAASVKQLVASGFTRLIIAGGETSGAVVTALGVTALEIGPEIDPGVPWTKALGTKALGGESLVLALKSGNFGAPDFFLKAWERLASETLS